MTGHARPKPISTRAHGACHGVLDQPRRARAQVRHGLERPAAPRPLAGMGQCALAGAIDPGEPAGFGHFDQIRTGCSRQARRSGSRNDREFLRGRAVGFAIRRGASARARGRVRETPGEPRPGARLGSRNARRLSARRALRLARDPLTPGVAFAALGAGAGRAAMSSARGGAGACACRPGTRSPRRRRSRTRRHAGSAGSGAGSSSPVSGSMSTGGRRWRRAARMASFCFRMGSSR
jgi:hypothetical protein